MDAIGDGVMREVIMEAIRILSSPEIGILEDLSNDDGYFSLKFGGFVSDDTLNSVFTLGVLCALCVIKAHAGPDPISPILIQAAIGGIDSIMDDTWLQVTAEQAASLLSILPEDATTPIPNNIDLRRLVESRMNCRVSASVVYSQRMIY